jgi:hypothetical protein
MEQLARVSSGKRLLELDFWKIGYRAIGSILEANPMGHEK